MVGLVIGCLVGWWINGLPEASHASWNTCSSFDPHIFLNLVKLMIGPLVFASVVQGIAGTGDKRGRPGRIGAKTPCTSR